MAVIGCFRLLGSDPYSLHPTKHTGKHASFKISLFREDMTIKIVTGVNKKTEPTCRRLHFSVPLSNAIVNVQGKRTLGAFTVVLHPYYSERCTKNAEKRMLRASYGGWH